MHKSIAVDGLEAQGEVAARLALQPAGIHLDFDLAGGVGDGSVPDRVRVHAVWGVGVGDGDGDVCAVAEEIWAVWR